jgi:dihydropyrimidinase
MRFDTIIQGGRLVSVAKTTRADLGIRGERIVAIGKRLAGSGAGGAKIIDARGRYVIPGGVDAHVHLDLPACGTISSDDFDSGTRAAACGGVTTVIDFATPYGDETLQQAVDNWHARADGKACVDYSFHVAITNWQRQRKDVRRMIDQGIPTFKQFMIYAERGWQSDDAAVFNALETLKDVGGLLMLHAESSGVLDLLIKRHHNRAEMRRYGARLHAITRPSFIEAEAIERVIHWTRVTGGRSFIVHMSTGEGADLVKRARDDGVDVLAETCPQYLVLDDRVFAGRDGHLYATSPQIRKPRDQKRLWQGLRNGEVCSVATDTCTFTRKQKARWKGDWTKIPMGMPGVETMLPIVYTHGVLKRRLTINQFVNRCCTTPAKVMGLFPRKGVLRVGSDADVAIIHPTQERRVDWRRMQTNCDWSPYQGWQLAGFAEHTFCRGVQVVRDYKFVGRNGHGQFIPRTDPGQP